MSIDATLIKACDAFDTPFYLMDLRVVEERARTFRRALEADSRSAIVAYPYKANPVPGVVRAARAGCLGAEVSSVYEYRRALQDGFAPASVFIGGVGKSRELLASSITTESPIKVDSLRELRRLAGVVSELGKAPSGVYLRIATLNAGRWSRFGLLPDEIPAALDLAIGLGSACLGLHFHLGRSIEPAHVYLTQINGLHPWFWLASRLIKPTTTISLSAGGGFPAVRGDMFASAMLSYADALETGLTSIQAATGREVSLVAEPGRALLEPAGAFICTVVDIKRREDGHLLTVDATRSFLPDSAPTEAVEVFSVEPTNHATISRVAGNLSYEKDVLVESIDLDSSVDIGSRLIFSNVGAYNIAAAAPWTAPVPAVLGWDGSGLSVLRQSQGWE